MCFLFLFGGRGAGVVAMGVVLFLVCVICLFLGELTLLIVCV